MIKELLYKEVFNSDNYVGSIKRKNLYCYNGWVNCCALCNKDLFEECFTIRKHGIDIPFCNENCAIFWKLGYNG